VRTGSWRGWIKFDCHSERSEESSFSWFGSIYWSEKAKRGQASFFQNRKKQPVPFLVPNRKKQPVPFLVCFLNKIIHSVQIKLVILSAAKDLVLRFFAALRMTGLKSS